MANQNKQTSKQKNPQEMIKILASEITPDLNFLRAYRVILGSMFTKIGILLSLLLI